MIESDLVYMTIFSHGIRSHGKATDVLPLARKLRKLQKIVTDKGLDMACGGKKKKKPKGK